MRMRFKPGRRNHKVFVATEEMLILAELLREGTLHSSNQSRKKPPRSSVEISEANAARTFVGLDVAHEFGRQSGTTNTGGFYQLTIQAFLLQALRNLQTDLTILAAQVVHRQGVWVHLFIRFGLQDPQVD